MVSAVLAVVVAGNLRNKKTGPHTFFASTGGLTNSSENTRAILQQFKSLSVNNRFVKRLSGFVIRRKKCIELGDHRLRRAIKTHKRRVV